MLFSRLIFPNFIGNCIKNQRINFRLKISISVISVKVRQKISSGKPARPFRRIQHFLGLFLLLFGGISVDSFASSKKRKKRSTISVPNDASSSSGVEGSAITGESHGEGENNPPGGLWGMIRNVMENDKIQSIIESTILPNEHDRIKSETKSLQLELKEEILSNGLKLPGVVDLLEERISEKTSNPYMRNVEIRVMGKFLDQDIPSDPERRSRIASKIEDLITDEHGSIRKSVVRVLGECLDWNMLSNPKRSEIFHKIAERLFDKHDSVAKTAEREVKRLWRSDFPIAEKSKIVSFVAKICTILLIIDAEEL